MAGRSAAGAAFEETLAELGVGEADLEIGDARALGRRAALLAVASTVWRRHLGPLLSTGQVAELLGVGTRQAVNDRVRRRRLLALPTHERDLCYPAFQFGANGRPYPEVGVVLEAFSPARLSAHTIGSWFVTPHASLDGATPVEWMADGRDAAVLAAAARRTAARTSR